MMFRKIKDPVLDLSMHLFFDGTYAEFVRVVKQKYKVELDESPTAVGASDMFVYRGKGLFYVFVKDRKDIATLVHELYHFVCRVLEFIGIEDEEMGARYIEYWYKKVMKIK